MKLFWTCGEVILAGKMLLDYGLLNPAFNAPLKNADATTFVMAVAAGIAYWTFILMVCRFVDELSKISGDS